MKLAVISALSILTAFTAHAEDFNFYGDAQIVSPGPAGSGEPAVVQLTSDTSGPGYAGTYYVPPGTLTVGELLTLSASYEMTEGTFGAGAPRFSIGDTTSNANNEAYIYWGTPTGGGSFTDPNAGTWANTGNYIDSTDVRVYNNGFAGLGNGNTGETWAQFVAQVGADTQIGCISLDLDGGFAGTQQVDVDDFTVNSAVYDATVAAAPEPGTFVLLGGGLALMVGFCRRTRARSL
jgi:hypothetical protein